MANDEHLAILKQGVEAWNRWRKEKTGIKPDLSGATFCSIDTSSISNGFVIEGDLLGNINLDGTRLIFTDFFHANLYQASFKGADLSYARLVAATLIDADFRGANLFNTDLSEADLTNADMTGAYFGATTFGSNNLSEVKGLDNIHHYHPSTIGIDTIYKSKGQIPESFLRGCGVPDDFITFAHSLVTKAIEFYSCFISYSTKDEEFAKRLHSRMRDNHLRVWFAPEDIKGGQKIHEQLERAIQVHDRLLIVLSESSMQSEWVMTEIRNARQAEIIENRRKLFPIRLVDFDAIRKWKCFDADTGKDLAVELREYFIPDFSNWKEHDSFEAGFTRLLNDLKAEESK